MANKNAPGLNFGEFKRLLELEQLNEAQNAMLKTRLQLLKSCLNPPKEAGYNPKALQPKFPDTKRGRDQQRDWERDYNSDQNDKIRSKMAQPDIWSFKPGTLSIVDLTCPFVDEGAACTMFDFCLTLFLEDSKQAGRIVVLDEAHKVRQSLIHCPYQRKMSSPLTLAVHERIRFKLQIHAKSPFRNPTTATPCHTSHHSYPGAYHFARTP